MRIKMEGIARRAKVRHGLRSCDSKTKGTYSWLKARYETSQTQQPRLNYEGHETRRLQPRRPAAVRRFVGFACDEE